MLHNVSGPGPVYSQPRSDICLISTLDGELPNGEILYMSYVFAFHFCQGTEQSRRVESWNISSTKLVPVISFLPTCFRALEKRELCHLWGGGREDDFLVLPTGRENEDGLTAGKAVCLA
jgi:hypothetical protein